MTKRRVLKAVFLVMLCFSLNAGSVEARSSEGGPLAVVTLPDVAIVQGEEIRLGEIAAIAPGVELQAVERESEWDALRRQLQQLTIGRAPLPGGKRTLFTGSVRVRLRQLGLSDSDVELRTEGTTMQVLASATLIPQEMLQQAIQEQLLASIGSSSELELSCSSLPSDITIPGENADYQVRVSPPSFFGAGLTSIPLEVWSGGQVQERLVARCSVAMQAEVVVASTSLDRHDVLAADDFHVEQRSLSQVGTDWVKAEKATDLVGRRTTRRIAPGEVLSWDMTETVPDVAAGSPVQLVLAFGAIQLVDQGRLTSDANVGSVVEVENVRTGKVLQGVLHSPGVVQISQ